MKIQTIEFLGIGAQKAATTWLCYHLGKHPSIWTPPRKELHYFDHPPRYGSSSDLASNYLFKRLLGRNNYHRKLRKQFKRDLLSAIRKNNWRRIHWTLRYYLGTRSDDWYLSLFEDGDGKVKGEITPCYSILDVKDVQYIRDLFPDLKIILLLRNPIDRAWSQIRFAYRGGWFKGINDTGKIRAFIEHSRLSLRGDYVRTIQTWLSCFPKEQMFIGWFDDIVQNPRKLLFDVFEFLGVEPAAFSMDEKVHRKINVSPKRDLPIEIRHYLAAKYHPELKKLNALVGGYSDLWLKEAENILKTTERNALSDHSQVPDG